MSSVEHPSRRPVWIDLDNTPHVPFFRPLIRELERRGVPVFLTARDAFQVCELAEQAGLKFVRVGRHSGRNRLRKAVGLVFRSLKLFPSVLPRRPLLAVSHGSRSQVMLANILRIPSVMLSDYEHAEKVPFGTPTWEITPDAIPKASIKMSPERVLQYAGLKEDVYAPDLRPNPAILDGLGIARDALVVTVRPPATEAHYHNPESELLLERLMELCVRTSGVRVVLLPRNRAQGDLLQSRYPAWFSRRATVIPPHALDGMNLIWHSDLVVSGGGTMNREAAALGVPVYSIFRGTPAAIDLDLERRGRLVVVRSADEVAAKIDLRPRNKSWQPENHPRPALAQIVGHLESIMAQSQQSPGAVRPS